MRILLVEDNTDDALLIQEMLASAREEGLCVECVRSLADGLERLSRGGIDAVLLDLTLPDSRDGESFARMHEQTPEVPIIVLTGNGDQALALDLLRQGAQEYVIKAGLNGRALVRIVQYAVERNRLKTALERTIRSLRLSQEDFHSIVRTIADGIVVVNREGTVRYVNPEAEVLFGRSKAELVGVPFGSSVPVIIDDATEARILRYQDGTHDVRVAETRAVEICWQGEGKDEGEIAWLISLHDITKRKRYEEQLKEKTEELQRSNKELERFAYVISHDLQEPLRMIRSYSQLLAKRYEKKLGSYAKAIIGHVVDGVGWMERLLQDLLLFSRVGTHGGQFAETESEDAFARALANLGRAIEETGAAVTHGPFPVLRADALQLTQLFQNLIGNAIKFHRDEPPKIHVSASRNGPEWVFAVSDNGIGIEAEYASRIFLVFQRLHGRGEYPGTGIGLAICKRIVERHGGRIWVESMPGEGSTFYFTVPGDAEEDA